MPNRSIKHASVCLLLGLLLTPVTSFIVVAASEMNHTHTHHSFGLIRRDGRFWSVEVFGVTGVTDVIAFPFDNEEQAQAHVDRQLHSMASVARLQAQPTFTLNQDFVPPPWESASTCAEVPPNTDAAAKNLNNAQNRAFGFPMRYGAWTKTEYRTADGQRAGSLQHVISHALPVPTRLIWPGAAIDVLFWAFAACGCMTMIRFARRKLRRKGPGTVPDPTAPPQPPSPSHP